MAKHSQKGPGTRVWMKLTGDTTWRLLHGLKNVTLPSATPEKIETTTQNSLNNLKEFAHGIVDPGVLELSVQLNLNTEASPTGVSVYNGLQSALWSSVGNGVVWDVHIALPKSGAAPSALSATPSTDVTFFVGQVLISEFPVTDADGGSIMETTITADPVGRFAKTDVI